MKNYEMRCVWSKNNQKLIIYKIEILEGRGKFQGLGAEWIVENFWSSSEKQISLERAGEKE